MNSADPRTANDALISMSSSIVRTCIANSTIHEILTNRKSIKDMMQKDMFNVVKGWGVWVETFEVTEVQISSATLFKDLQTKYREEIRQQSEICKMKFSSELTEIRQTYDAKQNKFRREIDQQRQVYLNAINLEINEE